MRLVLVRTKAFSGEFIHMSELPAEALVLARQGKGIYSEPLAILDLAAMSEPQRNEIQDLSLSQALKVWNAYRTAVPFERGMPDVLPEGM